MRYFYYCFWFLLFLLHGQTAFAQTYPVTVNTQLIPPYSVYLSDYVSPESEKLFVSLLFNDLTQASYNVRLRLTIEGVGIKIETKPELQLTPIVINSGVMERLGAAELAPYFDANNLIFQGITKQQYQKNAALPEGLYKFCIQAYDYNKNIPVSNKSCSNAWLILNDPPRLNTPTCNSVIKVIYPQNIIFQWLPMHLNSPNASEKTEYVFRLVHIQPQGRNPNDAINSTVPIFETTIDNSILYYGISEPQLIPGEQYAWRIQAKDGSGKDLFKNSGWSEVCMFTYGEPCKPPGNIQSKVLGPTKVLITWDNNPSYGKFKVRYREQGKTSASWYDNETSTNSCTIENLKPSKLYEFKVLTVCEPIESEYTKIDTFRVASPEQVDNCGVQVPATTIDQTTKLERLLPNDVIWVDGFKVRIESVSGGNGKFSGKGVAYIPFLGVNVKMKFSGIHINEKYEVYEGRVVAERTNMQKYYNKVPSPELKNDICQDVVHESTEGKDGKETKGDNGSQINNSSVSSDSIRVIILNGNTEIKPGDTIKVNGQVVIVTVNTEIKNGDVVVVEGKEIKVKDVKNETRLLPTLASLPQTELDFFDKIFSEMKDSMQYARNNLKIQSKLYSEIDHYNGFAFDSTAIFSTDDDQLEFETEWKTESIEDLKKDAGMVPVLEALEKDYKIIIEISKLDFRISYLNNIQMADKEKLELILFIKKQLKSIKWEEMESWKSTKKKNVINKVKGVILFEIYE